MSWVFQESDPMGGAAGEAYANTLKSPGMPPEHVLAREAIQNSVDAGVGDSKVMVRFRSKAVVGASKVAFVAAAGLEGISSRADKLELASPNCLHSLEKSRTPLSLLYVEDHNAEGLSGDPHDKGSNFYRLLLSLGDRSKARSARGTGGSYGFGKSVYSSSSAIQTIFAYTRFRTADGKEVERVFGCGYYASHEYRKINFSGRAWLGTKKKLDGSGRMVVDPLEGAVARKMAQSLGFGLRDEGDRGTTILIVDAAVDLAAIVKGVEDWWWPRLIENKLDVDVIDTEGQVHNPRPRKSESLRPFIDAFDIARQRADPKSGAQKFVRLNNLADIPLGTSGFVVVPLTEQGPVVGVERSNTVALIRAPLMVVAYKSFSETAPPVVGAFMAADETDLVLKKSEPPAHDRWDPESTNLRDESGVSKELVSAVLSRIKGGLKRFQSEAAPPAPPKQRRLSILERALGSYFKPQGPGGGSPPDSDASPLHLEFTEQPYAEAAPGGMLRLKSSFTVRLDSKSDEDEVDLRVRIGCPILEDEGQEGDDLGLKVVVQGAKAIVDKEDPLLYRFSLAKGDKIKFKIESEPYDTAWTVRLRPDINREQL
jgi:hypothetical protein